MALGCAQCPAVPDPPGANFSRTQWAPPAPLSQTSHTWSPERDALLLVGLADAVVAVAIHALARVPIVEVHVGRAVRAGPRAEFREVAGIAGAPTGRARGLQLQGQGGYGPGCHLRMSKPAPQQGESLKNSAALGTGALPL